MNQKILTAKLHTDSKMLDNIQLSIGPTTFDYFDYYIVLGISGQGQSGHTSDYRSLPKPDIPIVGHEVDSSVYIFPTSTSSLS